MKKQINLFITILAICGSVFFLTGCQEDESISLEKESTIEETSIYGNSKKVDVIIQSIYDRKNSLLSDWKNRDKYALDRSYFQNDYIYRYMTLYLYESVRYLTADETSLKSVEIQSDDIEQFDDLWLVPVVVTDIVRENGKSEEDIYEQFFIFKGDENGNIVIANFIAGYVMDKKNEVYPKVNTFTKSDWERSVYSKEGRETLKSKGLSDKSIDAYIDFIQSDMNKDEYNQTIKDQQAQSSQEMVSLSSSYNRSAAVNYATTYTSTIEGISSYNRAYKYFSVDCANFVSQALKAGGFVNRGNSYGSCTSWYYHNQGTSSTSDDTNSITWSTANGLKRYLWDCNSGLSTVLYASDLWYGNNVEVGDPFFSDWSYPAPGEAPYYEHGMIVTKIVGSDVRYSAHTNNRKNRTMHHSSTPYDSWFTSAWTRGFHIESLNGYGSKLI